MSPNFITDTEVEEVYLSPGEFFFGAGNVRIKTLLGSCVAITFWHPTKRIGGMCHYLLSNRGSNTKWPKGAFADECIELFMHAIKQANTLPSEYEVKLFGGSTMFGENIRLDEKKTLGENTTLGESAALNSSNTLTHQTALLKTALSKKKVALLVNNDNNISKINIETGFKLLQQHNLTVKASDVGGFTHRNIYLELNSGDVWVKRDRSR